MGDFLPSMNSKHLLSGDDGFMHIVAAASPFSERGDSLFADSKSKLATAGKHLCLHVKENVIAADSTILAAYRYRLHDVHAKVRYRYRLQPGTGFSMSSRIRSLLRILGQHVLI